MPPRVLARVPEAGCCGGGAACALRAFRWLGRPGGGDRGECFAAAAPGFRGQAFGGAAFVFFLPGVPGVQDALVPDDEQAGDGQREGVRPMRRHQPRLVLLVAGVFGGGEAAFGAGAAGVGAAVRGGWVVVFLRGLGKAPG
jgi:hypothetical protein